MDGIVGEGARTDLSRVALRLTIAFAVAVVCTTLVIVPSSRAAACSCAGTGMAESIASSEVAFVGKVTDRSEATTEGVTWQFAVRESIRGDVPAEVVVHGGDFMGGCGPDYGDVGGAPVVVVVERENDRYEGPACTPVEPAGALDELLAPLPRPDGSGPVAALVAHRYRWSNIAALDRQGRVLSWGYVDGGVMAIAHCRGSSSAAVTSWTSGSGQRLRFVDLTTMKVTGSSSKLGVPVDFRGDLECLDTDRGFEVVSTAADQQSDDVGPVRVAVSGARRGAVSIEGASDAVILSDGTVFVLPGRAGGPVSLVGGEPLATTEIGRLADREAAFVGAVNKAETKLAMVISEDNTSATYGMRATAIAVFEIDDDRSLTRTATLRLRTTPAVEATDLAWLDEETLAVERSTGNTKILDVYGLDGNLVSRTDIGWGWGDTVLDGNLLRSRHNGLELIAPDGTSTSLRPSPAGAQYDYGEFFLRAVDDGPRIDPQRPSPPRPRPVADVGPSPNGDDLADFGGGSSSNVTIAVTVAGVLAAVALAAAMGRRRRASNQGG